MITNESEIRIALQAVLISVLALYGLWGCALVVFIILLPWKPILAVAEYLVQPVVEWRMQKDRGGPEKSVRQVERELGALLHTAEGTSSSALRPNNKIASSIKPPQSSAPRPLESFRPNAPNRVLLDTGGTAQDLSTPLAIPTAIKNHVRNLPQGVFSNMDLAVEEVKFHGDTAEAYVRFQSPNVKELVIRQRYVLQKAGEHWQVESRQPANGAGKPPFRPPVPGRSSMRII